MRVGWNVHNLNSQSSHVSNAVASSTGSSTSSALRVQTERLELHHNKDAQIKFPDLSLHAKQELVLVGPSGSGKTTLLHMLAGLLEPTKGSISVAGEKMSDLPQRRLERFRAQHIGIVFQDFHLIEGYSSLENVVVALAAAGSPLAEARFKAKELLRELDLSHRLHHLPKKLSTGERQRVAIARAIATNPVLLLADEPTANLDRARGDAALELLRDVAQQAGAALIVSTHDVAVKEAFGDVLELV